MPGWFITTIIVAILALPAILTAVIAKPPEGRKDSFGRTVEDFPVKFTAVIASGALIALTFVFLLISCVTMVPTKTVGVVTSFGKPVGVIGNGLHWIAPWQKVVEFDASIQTLKRTGKGDCTTVRIYNQATACIDNSTRWRIKQDAAPDLYKDYRSFDNMKDSLINRELTSVLNEVFSTFDPLIAVQQKDTTQPAFSLDKLGQQATDLMRQRVGKQVEINSIVIPLVRYDKTTESKLDAFQAALADTRIAEQKKATSQREAEANAARKGELNDNTLKAQCLDVVRDAVRDGKQLPAGFTCLGGSFPVVTK